MISDTGSCLLVSVNIVQEIAVVGIHLCNETDTKFILDFDDDLTFLRRA